MWDLILSSALLGASVAFYVAHVRRIRPLPLSRRGQDRRAWYYRLCFLALNATWAIVYLVNAFVTRPH